MNIPEEVGVFEKVSFERYLKDWYKVYGTETADEYLIRRIYDDIKLPYRSTSHSAGYDFVAPFGFSLSYDIEQANNFIILTGIRVSMKPNYYLSLHPRSSLGFKHNVTLANTTGIIDADYYESDNEGHIMAKICYNGMKQSTKIEKPFFDEDNRGVNFNTTLEYSIINDRVDPLIIKSGDRFIQGIFVEYGIVENDDAENRKRNGGIGSTDYTKVMK